VRARQHYHRNIDKIHAYRRNEYIKNRDKLLNKGRLWQQKTIDSWRDYFPKTSCQVCGKELIFGSKNKKESIHFDHKNGGKEIIKGSPNHWLRRHPKP